MTVKKDKCRFYAILRELDEMIFFNLKIALVFEIEIFSTWITDSKCSKSTINTKDKHANWPCPWIGVKKSIWYENN